MLQLKQGQYLGINRPYYPHGSLRFVDTIYHQKVSEEWHNHKQAHLTFLLTGGNREKRKSAEFQRQTGQLVFYHSHELHRNDHTLFPSRNLNLEIAPAFFSDYQVSEQHIERALQTGWLTALELARMVYELRLNGPLSTSSLHMLLLSCVKKPGAQQIPNWLVDIRSLLNDCWATWPTLSELAAAAGVHPVTLSKYFPLFFGCTLSAYLRKIKVQRSLSMIRSGNYSLTQVSYACGFADQSHFVRCFKAHTGMQPKVFARF